MNKMVISFKSKWYILTITFMIYAIYHASRKPLSIIKPVLHKKCDNSDQDCSWKPFDGDEYERLIGSLEFAFLISYSVGLVICGHFAERSKLNRFLSYGLFLAGITNCLFGLGNKIEIHSFWYYYLVQIISGLFQASGWPAVMTLMGNWWGIGRRGFILGLWGMHCGIGNIIGSLISSLFLNDNWGNAFIYTGLLMCIFSVIALLTIYDNPNEEIISDKIVLKKPMSIQDAIRVPNVIQFSIILLFNKLVCSTFINWLPLYITNKFPNMEPQVAAYLSTGFDIGSLFGGLLAGYISDLGIQNSLDVSTNKPSSSIHILMQRTKACGLLLFFSVPCIYLYHSAVKDPFGFSLVLIFLIGLLSFGPCSLIVTAVSTDIGQQSSQMQNAKSLSTIIAIIDAFGSFGGAIGPWITGNLVKFGWSYVFSMLTISNFIAFLITCQIYSNLSKMKLTPF